MSVNLGEEYRDLRLGGCGNPPLSDEKAVDVLAKCQGMTPVAMRSELRLLVNDRALEAASEYAWQLGHELSKQHLRWVIETYLLTDAIQ